MTTTSEELFMAILAMDSYNREYLPKIGNMPIGTSIGNATILAETDLPNGAILASFAAVAYSYDGGTVISYRGTDDLSLPEGLLSLPEDVQAWAGGMGFLTEQSEMAAQFYKTVIGNNSPYDVNVTFVGHSLGGGLAGLMASLYNKDAYIFDYMPFQASAYKILEEVFNDPDLDEIYYFNDATITFPQFDKINAYSVTGEVLSALRYTDTIIEEEYASHGGLRHPIDLHSQALLVSMMYADKNGYTDWEAAAKPFMDSLFNNGVATAFNEVSADVMLSKIAYTAIESGVQPFGDAAIHTMFNDANDLGRVMSAEGASGTLKEYGEAIASAFVQYAGQLAKNQVKVGEASVDPREGVLHASGDGKLLTVDFSDAVWNAAGAFNTILGKEKILTQATGLLSSQIHSVMQDAWGVSGVDANSNSVNSFYG